ncbi:hypothetical protein BLOT_008089 [Blomia tropicalis]|nr:hypothetical protein BLOT_008089 [Blomia tropicalis]
MQRGSKVPMSDPLFETEDILRSLGLDDDMEETMEMDRVVWNSSIQTDVETKLLANRPPSTSAGPSRKPSRLSSHHQSPLLCRTIGRHSGRDRETRVQRLLQHYIQIKN